MRTIPTRTPDGRTPAARPVLRSLRTLAPALGVYLLTVALLAGILGLDLGITSSVGTARSHGLLGGAEVWGISAVIGCLLLYGLYAVRGARPRAEGLRVSREQQPELWSLADRAARAVGVRPPHQLWLTADARLTAWQNPHLLGLLPGRRRIGIGVPLLTGLTDQQLSALLATRLGPAGRSTGTPFPGLLRRNRDALRLILDRYADTSGAGPGPRKWFGGMYTGYARACLRWSAPDARRLTLAADRAAARAAGPGTTVAALRRAQLLDALHQRYRQDFVLTGWDEGACPVAAEVVPGFQDWLGSPDGQEALAGLESAPPRERIPQHDARLPLTERIALLEQLPPDQPGPSEQPAPAPAADLLADPLRTCAQVVGTAPGFAERRQLPWNELAAIAGQAELDAAAAGLLTSVTSVLRRRTPDLPTLLDAIDEGRWAELADWIPRTGAARTVPVAVGRSLNLSTATQGLHALVLTALVQQGGAHWTLDPRRGHRLALAPDTLDSRLRPALAAATAPTPDTAPLRHLLHPDRGEPLPGESV